MDLSASRRWALAVVLTGLVGIGASVAVAYALGLRVNLTPSLPLGLYARDPLGPLVEFCPPGAAAADSRAAASKMPLAMSELAATQFVHVSYGDFFADQLRFHAPAQL